MKIKYKLEDYYYGKTVKDQIRDFAALLALVIVLIALYKFKASSDLFIFLYALALANILIVTSNKNPTVIYPFWRLWMLFGALLSSVMSAVLLATIWTLMLTPLAFLARTFGLSTIKIINLGEKNRVPSESYWEVRNKSDCNVSSFTPDNMKLLY